jgi:Flp pilus assembly protein CpaB
VLQEELSVNRSNRLVIFVGVLLAILAFVGIVILLNNTGTGGGKTEKTTVTVVVAKADIKIGDPVTPDKVEEKEVDPTAVLQTPLGSASAATGQPALYAIPKGSQVTQEALGIGTGISISRQLQPGEKAIAFQVDRVTGLDFLIQPGDHVDIVLAQSITVLQPTQDTASKPAGQQRFETVAGLDKVRTVKAISILQNKRVLYVSQTRIQSAAQAAASPSPSGGSQSQQAAPIENVIIIIAGTDQDAELIKFAQNDVSEVGPLTAVLRSTKDTDLETTTGITIDKLVSQYGLTVPGIVQELQKAP